MEGSMQKRGLSPVVATILLISIVLVVAAIIFMWARGLLTEQTQKFDQPIERACELVKFEAEALYQGGITTIDITNQGRVAIHGLEVRKKITGDIGTIQTVGMFENAPDVQKDKERGVSMGETGSLKIEGAVDKKVNEGTLEVLPVLLGQKGASRTPYTCEEKYGRTLTIRQAV